MKPRTLSETQGAKKKRKATHTTRDLIDQAQTKWVTKYASMVKPIAESARLTDDDLSIRIISPD